MILIPYDPPSQDKDHNYHILGSRSYRILLHNLCPLKSPRGLKLSADFSLTFPTNERKLKSKPI